MVFSNNRGLKSCVLFPSFFAMLPLPKELGSNLAFLFFAHSRMKFLQQSCTPVVWKLSIQILHFKIIDINSNCKTYMSRFLEYIIASIFAGVSSTSRGTRESSGSGEAQEVVSFPHRASSSLSALSLSSNVICSQPLPETQYEVHSFERIRGEKWL